MQLMIVVANLSSAAGAVRRTEAEARLVEKLAKTVATVGDCHHYRGTKGKLMELHVECDLRPSLAGTLEKAEYSWK
jgi:hypothetical protein